MIRSATARCISQNILAASNPYPLCFKGRFSTRGASHEQDTLREGKQTPMQRRPIGERTSSMPPRGASYHDSVADATVFTSVSSLRLGREATKGLGGKVALVPTMGALHEGHTDLMKAAAHRADDVYVSIYVNPTQFGLTEDLGTYPKTWDEDMRKIGAINRELSASDARGRITAIFKPDTRTMYPGLPPSSDPNGDGSFVTVTPIGRILEGAARPVFFRGVATVCMKLFNIVQPDFVWFGQKDIQQTVLISQMIRDFHIDTQLCIGDITRDPESGLALSSRNVYLGARRARVAAVLHRALMAGRRAYSDATAVARERVVVAATETALAERDAQLALPPSQRARFEIDYISLADPETMEEIEAIAPDRGAVLSGAIRMLPVEDPQPEEILGLGGDQIAVRLIDNECLGNATRTLLGPKPT
jgi:pantoate--beta-alanine ligase